MMDDRMIFEVKRGSVGGATEWLVSGEELEPISVATSLRNGSGRGPRNGTDVSRHACPPIPTTGPARTSSTSTPSPW
jgi:hypothetical protein